MTLDVERVDFVSFPTQNIDRARRFYGETLGFAIETDGDNGIEVRAGQLTVGLVDASTIDRPAPTGLALRVADVATARAELEATGVEFDGATMDTGVCHMAFFRDPDGNGLMLHRRYAR